MPDISMCMNAACPLSVKCGRFLAEPSDRQSVQWGLQPDESGQCPKFWDVKQFPYRLRDDIRPTTTRRQD